MRKVAILLFCLAVALLAPARAQNNTPHPGVGKCPNGQVVNQLLPNVGPPNGCIVAGGGSGSASNSLFVTNFGASGSNTQISCIAVSGSPNLTCSGGVADFKAGQGYRADGVALATVLSTPGAPSVTPSNTASTTYKYQCAVVGTNANSGVDPTNGSMTPAGAITTITNGPTTLAPFPSSCNGARSTCSNTVVCPTVGNTTTYVLYKGVGSASPTFFEAQSSPTFGDYGQPPQLGLFEIPNAPSGSDLRGDYLGSIISANGTTIVLDQNSGFTGTITLEHDDRIAIQSALAAAHSFGGGKVIFPSPSATNQGIYNVDVCLLSAFGGNRGLGLWGSGPNDGYSNLEITSDGPGPATIRGRSCRNYYWLTGSPIFTNLPFLINPNTMPFSTSATSQQAVHALTGSTPAGSYCLTLATDSDASLFTKGLEIMIRTGNVGGGTITPDSEINFVTSSNTSNGQVCVQSPTWKLYQQEYFITGTSGDTSTTPTANPAPYGLAIVQPWMVQGLLNFHDLNFDGDGAVGAFNISQVTDVNFQNITSSFISALGLGGGPLHKENIINVNETAAGSDGWGQTGSNDIFVGNTRVQFLRESGIQMNEGASGIVMDGDLILGSGVSTWPIANYLVASRGRSHSITIVNSTFIGDAGPGGATIRIDNPDRVTIANDTFQDSVNAQPAFIWALQDNYTSSNYAVTSIGNTLQGLILPPTDMRGNLIGIDPLAPHQYLVSQLPTCSVAASCTPSSSNVCPGYVATIIDNSTVCNSLNAVLGTGTPATGHTCPVWCNETGNWLILNTQLNPGAATTTNPILTDCPLPGLNNGTSCAWILQAAVTLTALHTTAQNVVTGCSDAATTTTGSQTLPEATVTVGSTTGCPSTGSILVNENQVVTYTGLTGTTFTGATGGSGTISGGAAVTCGDPIQGVQDATTATFVLGTSSANSSQTADSGAVSIVVPSGHQLRMENAYLGASCTGFNNINMGLQYTAVSQ